MKSTMQKNLLRTIKKSLGRFIAIMAIIALGAGIFVGLLATKTDMIATGQEYLRTQIMFDLRLLSNYGWTDREVDRVEKLEGISGVQPAYMLDVLGRLESRDKEDVFQLYSMPSDMNKLLLIDGRMPEAPNECLIDGKMVDAGILGTKFLVSDHNKEDTLDSLKEHTLTVVGIVRSPLFMDFSRGNTSLGDGSIAAFLYLPVDSFSMDYYTEIDITLAETAEAYTDTYNDQVENHTDRLEPLVLEIAQGRYETLHVDAEKEYADGYREYEDGLQEIADAEKKLQDAYRELTDGQQEIDKNRADLLNGEKKLQDGRNELNAKKQELNRGSQELASAKEAAYEELNAAEAQLTDQENDLNEKLTQAQTGLDQINQGLEQLNEAIAQLEALIAQMGGTATEEMEQQLQALYGQKTELETQQKELQAGVHAIEQGLTQITQGKQQLQASRAEADAKFQKAEADISAGMTQISDAEKELNSRAADLETGKQKLQDAQRKLDDGKAEYEKEKVDADLELADARQELRDAEQKLQDARREIDDMEEAKVYLLGRNTNVGYLSLDSNSDIVAGVSRVFPAFFLLVASLVCITTMTRMVEEERTQIGTLKALGYSSGSIISKYLLYAGSAAVLGCGLGVAAGSIIFPKIIWQAYNIVLSLSPKLIIKFDIPLCIIVVTSYTAVILLVTWYTCRKSLREVPAELIRPKAPTTGKKIFLEYLPFWKHVSFLNKVTWRNIFRYHQRLLMMLVGIGGCTALLVTGFGIGDSIKDIVSYQYAEVTQYDMQVQFDEGRTDAQQKEFAEHLHNETNAVQFAYQASMDITRNNLTKSLYMIATDDGIQNVFDLHRKSEPINQPKAGEAVISIGIAQDLDIHVGDTITARSKDMKDVSVKISGIFENNIDNYLLVSPETLSAQWGEKISPQLAFLTVKDDLDVHNVGAGIKDMDHVSAVFINKDLADQVDSMLGAMDMIVVTVVICAGILAVIVLYNLTNINITERLREIATIKVLGFRENETSAYVFKENIILSVMGCAVGLGFGKLLLDFVMEQIKIDTIWFQSRIDPISILYAIIITMLMTLLVDFALSFRLGRINMAEALKSVE